MQLTKHPKSLFVFFSTEMWERYGFYTVQSLLALYLVHLYHLPDGKTYQIVGIFTALTYISPIVGGYIADKLFGQKKSVLVGAFILCISYYLIALNLSLKVLLFALSGIAVGTGLLKPNISSLLGKQYVGKKVLRDNGFIIFYMGITTGIILGTVVPPLLQQYWGWSSCFLSAAIGLLLAIFIFYSGIRHFNIADCATIKVRRFFHYLKAAGCLIFFWLFSFTILAKPKLDNIFFLMFILIALTYVAFIISHEEKKQRAKSVSLLLLCSISVVFWAFYFQIFLSLTLFIARVVKHTFLGIPFYPPTYVAVESVGMLLFGFMFIFLFKENKKKMAALAASKKFLLAMCFMSLAYGLICLSLLIMPNDLFVSPFFILLAYLNISVAELLLSPVGLAVVTKLAHPKKVGTFMGVFFISLGLGGFFAEHLAALSEVSQQIHSIVVIKKIYLHAFTRLFMLSLLAVLLTAAVTYKIKQLS